MKKRIASVLLIMLLLVPLFCFSSSADTGPKPSVTVNIRGIENETYYVTLLSEEEGTGPWYVDSTYCDYYGPKDVWKAFCEYKDSDGYYFINCFADCTETDSFLWSYYPPEKFKVLVYLPESGEFIESGIYETYAFHTNYTMDLSGADLGSPVPLSKSLHYSHEILSFACRALICLAAEMLVALFFGLTAKKQLKIIFWTNLVTQVILNAALFGIGMRQGPREEMVWLIMLEIAIFVIEGVIYALTLKKHAKNPEKKTRSWAYSLCANAFSLVLGFVIVKIIPQIF